MNIVTLETGLFPDQDRVEDAVEALDHTKHTITRFNLTEMTADDDGAWDTVVQEIMKAAKVITI